MNNLILLKNVVIIPELFLGISIIYLFLFGSIISTYKTYPLIQNLILNLSVLVLFLCTFLIYNDTFLFSQHNLFFEETIVVDYLSFIAKLLISIFSLVCVVMIGYYVKDQKLNHFEYFIIILISILGFFYYVLQMIL